MYGVLPGMGVQSLDCVGGNMHGEAGKGDAPRPITVPRSEYEENWRQAFGPQPNDCDICNGTGSIWKAVWGRRGGMRRSLQDCPVCMGTGRKQ